MVLAGSLSYLSLILFIFENHDIFWLPLMAIDLIETCLKATIFYGTLAYSLS